MSDLPEPLVPAGTDITGLDGFMLDTERLMASELWALSTGEEFKAAFGLWCRAWKQDPPGSLPNDPRVLAAFSGAGARWPKVKAMALRGFVPCSDGRLYHQVLCSDVLRAAKKKAERRERTKAATAARQRERNEDRNDLRDVARYEQRDVDRDVNVTRSHRRDRDGTGTGQGSPSVPPHDDPKLSTHQTGGGAPAAAVATWAAYSASYRERYGAEPIRNAKTNGQIAQFCKRVPAEEAPFIAAFYVTHRAAYYAKRGHAIDCLLADAEKLRTEWATNHRITETAARQGDATQAAGQVWDELIAEAEAHEARIASEP